MNKRIEWIDFLKGFLILTVLIGHLIECPKYIKIWIYTFHMPLFFFLSGYTLNFNKYDLKRFIVKKIKTLLIPGLIFMLMINIYDFLFFNLSFTVKNIILGCILQMRGQDTSIPWFLVGLFSAEIALYVINKILKDNKKKVSILLIILSILNFLFIKYAGNILSVTILPYSMDLIFIICPFIYLGYLSKQNMILIPIKNGKLNMLITFIIGNILECISYKILGYHFDLYSAAIGSYTLYYLTAIFQINWLVLLFKKLKPTKLIHYIGKNSLVYYALHAQIFVMFDKILKNIVYVYIHGLIKLSVTIIILTIISIIINKYFPFIVGKKRCNNDI